MERRICLIVNPSAGRGRAARVLPDVEAALRSHGLPFRVERTSSLAHARELARSALEASEVAAALGGDGLAGAVAGELAGTGGVLGVLPGGRGNDFARKLGISGDAAEACGVLATGAERTIDVAEADGAAFLGVLSAGIDSVVQDIVERTRLPLGELVYVYGALRGLATWRAVGWEVEIDGSARSFSGFTVAVANSGMYGGGMRLAPDARLDDGQLDVVLLHDASRLHAVTCMVKMFKGTHVHDAAVEVLPAREVTFRADRPFTAYADGDPIAPLPVTVRVRPGALRVLAPGAPA